MDVAIGGSLPTEAMMLAGWLRRFLLAPGCLAAAALAMS
jgi:hypothetical protein